jgi:hypothetical protein
MIITAGVCSIVYRIVECTHTAALVYSFHCSNINLSRYLNRISNIIWTCTAFNDNVWQELRFWCHNLAEFFTACKKSKFWYRPLLLFGSRNELKTCPLRFSLLCSYEYPMILFHCLTLVDWYQKPFVHSFLISASLRQIHSVFQSEFTDCELVVSLSISGILGFLKVIQ